jgi:glycopeptide antibiotics resistance protein
MINTLTKRRIFYGLITLLIAIEIFLFSNISFFPGIEKIGFDVSILYHFGVFFMFTFFLTLTLINKKLDKKTILIILLISLAYSLSDEFHQLFVAGRFADVKDLLTDFAGSIFSVLTIKLIEKWKRL